MVRGAIGDDPQSTFYQCENASNIVAFLDIMHGGGRWSEYNSREAALAFARALEQEADDVAAQPAESPASMECAQVRELIDQVGFQHLARYPRLPSGLPPIANVDTPINLAGRVIYAVRARGASYNEENDGGDEQTRRGVMEATFSIVYGYNGQRIRPEPDLPLALLD